MSRMRVSLILLHGRSTMTLLINVFEKNWVTSMVFSGLIQGMALWLMITQTGVVVMEFPQQMNYCAVLLLVVVRVVARAINGKMASATTVTMSRNNALMKMMMNGIALRLIAHRLLVSMTAVIVTLMIGRLVKQRALQIARFKMVLLL